MPTIASTEDVVIMAVPTRRSVLRPVTGSPFPSQDLPFFILGIPGPLYVLVRFPVDNHESNLNTNVTRLQLGKIGRRLDARFIHSFDGKTCRRLGATFIHPFPDESGRRLGATFIRLSHRESEGRIAAGITGLIHAESGGEGTQ